MKAAHVAALTLETELGSLDNVSELSVPGYEISQPFSASVRRHFAAAFKFPIVAHHVCLQHHPRRWQTQLSFQLENQFLPQLQGPVILPMKKPDLVQKRLLIFATNRSLVFPSSQ